MENFFKTFSMNSKLAWNFALFVDLIEFQECLEHSVSTLFVHMTHMYVKGSKYLKILPTI